MKLFTYHGDTLCLRELAERTGFHYATITRWSREGKLDAARIDRLLVLRELREVAVRNGVALHAARIRRWRGWPEHASYTTPHNGRLAASEGNGQ
jgi:hypothetical protein